MANQNTQYNKEYYDNLKQSLHTDVKNIFENYKTNPEKITELLEYQSQFYNYSIVNNILIKKQNPYATFVASYNAWKEKGYNVNKGVKGLSIFVPVITETFISPEDKSVKTVSKATKAEKEMLKKGQIETSVSTYFKIGHVFDISQTNCPTQDYPKIFHMGYSSEKHSMMYDRLKGFCESINLPVEEKDLTSISLRGLYTPATNSIVINDKLSDTEKLSTLSHEIGHAIVHHVRDLPTAVREYEADCISIMLQSRFSMPITDSRKEHLVEHYNNLPPDFEIDKSLSRVCKAFTKFYDEFTNSIEVEKEYEQEQDNKQEKVKNIAPDGVKSITQQNEANIQSDTIPTENKAKKDYYKYNEDDNKELCDAIKQNVDITELARAMGYTVVRDGRLYTLAEHDSVKIYPDSNSFVQFSQMKPNGRFVGGSPIDFAMHMGGMERSHAIEMLKNQFGYIETIKHQYDDVPKKPKQIEEAKEFLLPKQVDGKQSRAFAYLTKTRGIEPSIVSDMMKQHYVYEDERHNAVFCGKDKNGEIVYATKRSTSTESKYRGDVAGSNQEVGVFVNNNAPTLVVNEAFIDSMSYMTLMHMKGKDYKAQNYLAVGGVSGLPVIHHLRENPDVKKVVLGLDNDKAGKQTVERIKGLIHDYCQENNRKIEVCTCLPHEKDFNQDLVKARGQQGKKFEKAASKKPMMEMER